MNHALQAKLRPKVTAGSYAIGKKTNASFLAIAEQGIFCNVDEMASAIATAMLMIKLQKSARGTLALIACLMRCQRDLSARESQASDGQRGCAHASMDLRKVRAPPLAGLAVIGASSRHSRGVSQSTQGTL